MTKFCPNCEDYRDIRTENRTESYTVRGKSVCVPVAVEVCEICGEALGTDEQDQQIMDIVYAQYRQETGLLTPKEIKSTRERYQLSQKSFAALLGMSEVTINRYEQGGLQDPSHDSLLRACKNPEYIRELLQARGGSLSEWQRKRVAEALAGQIKTAGCHLDIDFLCTSKEISEYTGFRPFSYKRFSFVVAWFCKRYGSVSTTVVNKLLFYTDFLNFKTSTVSLTGATYIKLPYGPVPNNYEFWLSRMEYDDQLIKEEVGFRNGNTGYFYRLGPNQESVTIEVTDHERRVLESVAKKFKSMNAKRISDYSHQESAWQNTKDKENISYSEAKGLTLDFSDH